MVSVNTVYVNIQFKDLEKLRFSCKFEELENYLQLIKMKITAHLQSSVFKLSKDLIDSIHEEGIVAYTS